MNSEEKMYGRAIRFMYLKVAFLITALLVSFAVGYSIGNQAQGVIYYEHPDIAYHRKVAQSLTSETLQKKLKDQLDSTEHSYLGLLDWEHNRLNYTEETFQGMMILSRYWLLAKEDVENFQSFTTLYVLPTIIERGLW